MQSGLKFGAVFLGIGVLFTAAAPVPLRTAREVKHLSPAAARQNPPVFLKGTVTQVVPEWWGFSLQDSTDGVYVSAGNAAVGSLKIGQVVEVEGKAAPGNFAPMVQVDRIRVIGEGPLPPARPASWRDLAAGRCDNDYVEVEAVVRSAGMVAPPHWEWRALALRLDIGGNLIWAYLRDPGALPRERLVDSTVRVRAVCIVFSNSRRQFQGSSLVIPRDKEVQILELGPRDPFNLPLQPMTRVFAFSTAAPSFHRVKVEGVVTAALSSGLYLQQGKDGMLIRTAGAPAARPGDRVEAVGFPVAGGFSTVLEDALIRVTGHGAEPSARETKADVVLTRTMGNVPVSPDAVLVRIEGRVVESTRSVTEEMLLVQQGNTVFSARLRSPPEARYFEKAAAGSQVAVTGVCSVHVDERGLPQSFELLVRTPADVRVLKGPPWLNRTLAVRVAGILLCAVVLAVVWVGLLHRRVRQQTETIQRARDELDERVRARTAELANTTERLRASEERFRLAVENFPYVFVIYDHERRIQFINEAGAEIAGRAAADAIGRRDEDLFPPSITECYLPVLKQCLETRAPQSTECTLKLPVGTSRFIFNYVPVVDEDGKLTQILGITHDISERKRLEDQLHHSQKMESVGQLAGGVAHDFNNLLTVITGYAEMSLESLQGNDELRGSLSEISKAARRAEGLTRQLLTFSRRQMAAPKTVDLDELVANLEKMLRRLIREDLELNLSLNAPGATVLADPGQLEQVIMNLVVNARDAMPEGGRLAIETSHFLVDEGFASSNLDVHPGKYVLLKVSDTGTGMPPEVQARIFEPFFTTKEQGKGTGLGLSTVYGIVKQTGAAIFVYSEVGRGTVFRVLFPLGEAQDELVLRPLPDLAEFSGTETILVAEDEPGVRKLIRESLEPRGYTVFEAGNGREALELAQDPNIPIDLLLSDIVMPELGGAALAERFWKLRPGTPVLHMSGYTDRIAARDIQAPLLEKPFTPSVLLQRIREILDAAKNANAGSEKR